MILEIIAVILVAILIYLLRVYFNSWAEINKWNIGKKSIVEIKANRNIDEVSFTDGKEKTKFVRKKLMKGEKVEFVYPISKNVIVVKIKSGDEEKDIEVEY